MPIRTIECESCEFVGELSYGGDFSKSDISYCPACGGDITEDYNLSDDECDESEQF